MLYNAMHETELKPNYMNCDKEKIMKKFVTIILTLVSVFCVFAGCTGNQTAKQADVNEVYNKLNETGDFGQMLPVSDRDMYEIYGINMDKIKQAAFYMSENSSIDADEIAIFEVNDPEYLDALYNILCTRIANQINLAKTYSQDQTAKLEKTEVKKVGNFCYYVVSDNYNEHMKLMKDNIG